MATSRAHDPVTLRRSRPSADQEGTTTPHQEETTMKTMTCRALGGPCDTEHVGDSADDVINAQDRHLKEVVRAGDVTHQEARDAMKNRWRHPKRAMGWYRDVQQAFAALPNS